MIEKFYSWSDHDGNMESSITKDELITNIMIYWVSQSINSSIRVYAENVRASYMGGLKSRQRAIVPAGISLFPKEAQFPRAWAERMVNVASFSIMKKGGHFAALEVPEIYAGELINFFSQQ
jgi:microsomal epoxide hydrolase